MTPAAKFGRRLRSLRKAHKLKIGQLAEQADTGVKHLGRIERGEKQPSFELIVALAEALNISPAALFETDLDESSLLQLRSKARHLLDNRNVEETKKAFRVLKAALES